VGRIDFLGYNNEGEHGFTELEVVMSRHLDHEKMFVNDPVAIRRSVR
jgi:hypothetical protein